MVLNGCFTKKTINNELFGPMGLQRKPYSEIVASWRWQKFCIINVVRFIVYPIALVLEIVFSPITIGKYLYRNCCATNNFDDYTIKPTVGEIDFTNLKKK